MNASKGSIPAWAGETDAEVALAVSGEVYPRVGGGNESNFCIDCLVEGLSPRGRGKRFRLPAECLPRRSIPAWAGETLPSVHANICGAVYPRVGGGNESVSHKPTTTQGLSPRGRGKPQNGGDILLLCGSIPAWAGETGAIPVPQSYDEVYPRVGGGNAGIVLSY